MADHPRERLARLMAQAIDRLAERGAAPADLLAWRTGQAEQFADLRGVGRPGRKPKQIEAVNAYQRDLESAYRDWADTLSRDVAAAPDDKRDEIIAAALLALLALLRGLGRRNLPDAVALGLSGTTAPADIWAKLSKAIADNDDYLEHTLLPALRQKMDELLRDPDVLASLEFGPEAAAEAVRGGLGKFLGRIAGMAGVWWALNNYATGTAAQEQDRQITAHLDPKAHHCEECPQYHDEGGRVYASFQDYLDATGDRMPGQFECGGNCRCWLEY